MHCRGRYSRRRFALVAAGLVGAAWLVGALAFSSAAQAYVYWVDNRREVIGRSNLDGSGVNRRFIRGLHDTAGLAITAKYIYWLNYNLRGSNANSARSIGRARIDGTHVRMSLVTGVRPNALAADAHHLYFTDGPNALNASSIVRANLDGTAAVRVITPGSAVVGLAVDRGHIYWTNRVLGDGQFRPSVASIGRVALDGTFADPNFISIPAEFGPLGIAVHSGRIFWGNNAAVGNSLGVARVDGSGVQQKFLTAKSPNGIAADAKYVYWAAGGTGSIGRANRDGTKANPRFLPSKGANSVAVDKLGPRARR